MKTAEARTLSKFERSLCKRCGGSIYMGDPIFLWDEVWVCERCNRALLSVGEVSASTDWVEALFADVPDAYRSVVFKALATAFHPDHGGDAGIMRRILEQR